MPDVLRDDKKVTVVDREKAEFEMQREMDNYEKAIKLDQLREEKLKTSRDKIKDELKMSEPAERQDDSKEVLIELIKEVSKDANKDSNAEIDALEIPLAVSDKGTPQKSCFTS